jgi:hypothetical protein
LKHHFLSSDANVHFNARCYNFVVLAGRCLAECEPEGRSQLGWVRDGETKPSEARVGELNRKTLAVFILLGLGVYVALSRIPNGAGFVTSAFAVIDIVLVFAIFKGDVRIT